MFCLGTSLKRDGVLACGGRAEPSRGCGRSGKKIVEIWFGAEEAIAFTEFGQLLDRFPVQALSGSRRDSLSIRQVSPPLGGCACLLLKFFLLI